MKIAQTRDSFTSLYPNAVILIRKWIFWVALDEDAFFMAKYFSMKLTPLDKAHIKVWFPDSSLALRLKKLTDAWLAYVLVEKPPWENKTYEVKKQQSWKHFASIFSISIEDYALTKERILWLATLWLKEKHTENFLLKDKIEDIHTLLSHWLMKLPRKERYYFRDKIEILLMDILEHVYMYMYNLWERQVHIEEIYSKVLVAREFTRFLYKSSKIMKDWFYLDIWERWIEVLKIVKTLRNKHIQ